MQYNLATVKTIQTSTQGCIRGLTHACVCVEEGKGEGYVGRRMCTSFCKLHFPQGYMKGLMTVGERLGEF